MSHHIKDWVLEVEFQNYQVTNGEKAGKKTLPNLSKINIFVGANNSGKSRFMRKLASQEQVYFSPKLHSEQLTENLNRQNQRRDAFLQEVNTLLTNYGAARASALAKIDTDKEPLEIVAEGVNTKRLEGYLTEITDMKVGDITFAPLPNQRPNTAPLERAIVSIAATYKQLVSQELEGLPNKINFIKIYIPTLRGLRTFTDVSDNDIYFTRTAKDYFKDKIKNTIIFTGLTLYSQIHDLLTGNFKERRSVAEFEKFISKSFFNGNQFTLIPRKEGVLYVKIGDETELAIHELGDGIQSIIILTFPLFSNKGKNLLVFYEEPELYLHPGIQRLFLEVLCHFPDNQYFLTTHSNHFLDITLDLPSVSVYTFQKQLEESEKEEKESRFIIENVSNENNISLQLLGVRNSSVFLSNCTIWVEGITDRRYFSKYLELYQKTLENGKRRFKEDLHYSFVEYGGSNITHWSFLDEEADSIEVERLCSKLFLITDKDSSNGKKSERYGKLETKLGERYCLLPCREVENLLSPHIISAVVKSYERESTLSQIFVYADYKEQYLGTFIEETILLGKKTRNGSYAAQSGTISDKTQFCERAISQTKSFEDLSEDAKIITKKIYNFIELNN
jgi:AAA ATPase domain